MLTSQAFAYRVTVEYCASKKENIRTYMHTGHDVRTYLYIHTSDNAQCRNITLVFDRDLYVFIILGYGCFLKCFSMFYVITYK